LRKFEDNNKGKDERKIADFAMDQDHGWVAKDAASAPRVAIAEFVFMAVRSRFFGIAK
jgi:hypothetical protein